MSAIYLAHPLDDTKHLQAYDGATATLLEAGFYVYRPGKAWEVGNATPHRGLQAGNEAVLRVCDGVLVLLPPKVRTVGTVLELGLALQLGKPTVVWAPEAYQSWALAGRRVTVTENLGEAVRALRQKIQRVPITGSGTVWIPTITNEGTPG